jgi:hypothetical protein
VLTEFANEFGRRARACRSPKCGEVMIRPPTLSAGDMPLTEEQTERSRRIGRM